MRRPRYAPRRCASGSSTSTSSRARGTTAPRRSSSPTRSTRSSSPTARLRLVWEVEHHFLEEYSHSSRLRGLPRGRLAAHEEHPPGLRDRRHAARLPAPRARGREGVDARPRLDGRVEFGTGETSSGAELGGLRRRPRDQARAVGGGARRGHAHVRRGAVRRHTTGASSRCRSATSSPSPAEAAPAAVGRVLAAGDDPPRGREGHGRAAFSFVEPEEAKRVGRRVPRDHRVRPLRPRRLRRQPAASPSCCR